MQQNLRAGLYMMAREIRSVGYDPELTGNFGFVTDFNPPDDIFTTDINYATDKTVIAFTTDSDITPGNPGTGPGFVDRVREEQAAYRLFSNQLQRYNAETTDWEIVADNIDALDFVLVDQSGAVTTDPTNVAAVEITLLVRTDEQDKSYTNTQIYRNKRGQNICPSCSNDHYRRRVLSTTIGIRN